MAGIIFDEYAADPTLAGYLTDSRFSASAVPLCRQVMDCGPSPAVSQPFKPTTQFLALTIGDEVLPSSPPIAPDFQPGIFYQTGLNPVVTPASPQIAIGLRTLVLPVVAAQRIAFAAFGT